MSLNCKQNDYQVLQHLKDKKKRKYQRGVCMCMYRQGWPKKHCATPTVKIPTALSTSLTTVHISRCKSETRPMRGD